MSGINLDSFTLAGANLAETEGPSAQMGAPDEARPSAPAYKVQPVAWMFLMLGLAVIGLYFFLED